jgi:hypothetical protein
MLALLALVPALVLGQAWGSLAVLAHEHGEHAAHTHVVALHGLQAIDEAHLGHGPADRHAMATEAAHETAAGTPHAPHGQVIVVFGPTPLAPAPQQVAAAAPVQWPAPSPADSPLVVADRLAVPRAAPESPPPLGRRSGVERLLLSSHALRI